MDFEIIKTEKQYKEYLDWVDDMFDAKIKPDTPDGDKLKIALLLIKQYEDKCFPMQILDSNNP